MHINYYFSLLVCFKCQLYLLFILYKISNIFYNYTNSIGLMPYICIYIILKMFYINNLINSYAKTKRNVHSSEFNYQLNMSRLHDNGYLLKYQNDSLYVHIEIY